MSVCIAEQMGISGKSLQDLTVCALLHDNALTQYIQEELHSDLSRTTEGLPHVGAHCSSGENNIRKLPFHTDVSNVILYHHENADGSGPFGKAWMEVPLFARIVDYKSPFTSTHSIGVAVDAEKLTRYMGFAEETAQKMYLAGALHDIGKVAIGNEILEKPGRLTDDEFTVMKHHAAYTYYILSEIDDFEEIRDWAAFHHERLDGNGYPFGKSAAELNTQERIMACVDIYQALTESHPYKKGMPHEKACQILQEMADKGWLDPDITAKIDDCFRS